MYRGSSSRSYIVFRISVGSERSFEVWTIFSAAEMVDVASGDAVGGFVSLSMLEVDHDRVNLIQMRIAVLVC